MEIIQQMIPSQGHFPGNPIYALLIYKQAFANRKESPEAIQMQLKKNHWSHSWVGSLYNFHHYHSNTHEALVIISGECQAQFGGDNGPIYTVTEGDVVIIPAGVAHKSLSMSNHFQCIGAYSSDVEYDMHHGNSEEYSKAVEAIQYVELPQKDPIFGENRLLFNYWK